MNLYLVRHGQSFLNAEEKHQTASDKLSPHGKEQARVLAKRFQDIPIETIVASPFERTQQTAQIIANAIQKTIETNQLLTEVKRPTEIEGRRLDEPEVVRIKQLCEDHAEDPSWRYSDEETFFEFKERARLFLAELETRSEQHILVVTHGHFIKMLICVMMFGDELTPTLKRKFFNTFAIQNTSITVCKRIQGAAWRVLQWNDDAHLGELART